MTAYLSAATTNTFTANLVYSLGTASANTLVANWPMDDTTPVWGRDALDVVNNVVKVPKRPLDFELPDGATLHVSDMGEYFIDDYDARVIYNACRIREFNPYVNASDLIAKFIAYVGSLGVKRDEVAHLPLGLLVNWLIVEAAEKDGDPIPADVVPVPEHRLLKGQVKPRCLGCQRFIRRTRITHGFPYCLPRCAVRYGKRVIALN